MAFRYKDGVKQGYVRQGYIYFISRRYKEMPPEMQKKIVDLCLRCGGEYYQALFDFVTTDASATSVCLKHCTSKSTLYRCVRRYYDNFPPWI